MNKPLVLLLCCVLFPVVLFGAYRQVAVNNLRHQVQDYDDHLLRLDEMAPSLRLAYGIWLKNDHQMPLYDEMRAGAKQHADAALTLRRSLKASPFYSGAFHETNIAPAGETLEHIGLQGNDLRYIEAR